MIKVNTEKIYILDINPTQAAKDLTKVKSNILDKVKADVKAELLNSDELKQLINDAINNN